MQACNVITNDIPIIGDADKVTDLCGRQRCFYDFQCESGHCTSKDKSTVDARGRGLCLYPVYKRGWFITLMIILCLIAIGTGIIIYCIRTKK